MQRKTIHWKWVKKLSRSEHPCHFWTFCYYEKKVFFLYTLLVHSQIHSLCLYHAETLPLSLWKSLNAESLFLCWPFAPSSFWWIHQIHLAQFAVKKKKHHFVQCLKSISLSQSECGFTVIILNLNVSINLLILKCNIYHKQQYFLLQCSVSVFFHMDASELLNLTILYSLS